MKSALSLPDGLAEALGRVVADVRREFEREHQRGLELLEAQCRAFVAEWTTRRVTLEAEIKAAVDSRIDAAIAKILPAERGEPGEPGEVGPQGEMGISGLPGEKGEQGPPGERGVDGRDGIDGEAGPQGEKGAPGERGEKGDPGEPGEGGEQGPPGEAGRDGIDGINGKDGVGVAKVLIGQSGEWIVMLTDGTTQIPGFAVREAVSPEISSHEISDEEFQRRLELATGHDAVAQRSTELRHAGSFTLMRNAMVAAVKESKPPTVNITLPKKGKEVTTVQEHDEKGRIVRFVKEEVG